ncbi:unnamed protein product [Diatraea saccharalis]|uniref:Uncharacterized protein n=1 Tax=Diatraea saccharalis TaxID=40085 RepID=A0A9N9QVR7_9NEOP|nr:unnamed protein product [Diatraea saccharalis]
MQRENALKLQPTTSRTVSSSSKAALILPEDEESFYTASLQFLEKRLQEKTHNSTPKSNNISLCCSNLLKTGTQESKGDTIQKNFDELPSGSPLSIHQLLPFPKTSKESFFSRLKNTFRKYQRNFSMAESNTAEELEVSKSISDFKLPVYVKTRCVQSSCLVQIKEENSKEYLNTLKIRDSCTSSRNCDIIENTVKSFITR